jgi:hypothetical protein
MVVLEGAILYLLWQPPAVLLHTSISNHKAWTMFNQWRTCGTMLWLTITRAQKLSAKFQRYKIQTFSTAEANGIHSILHYGK